VLNLPIYAATSLGTGKMNFERDLWGWYKLVRKYFFVILVIFSLTSFSTATTAVSQKKLMN
jgi:hypothetical protein